MQSNPTSMYLLPIVQNTLAIQKRVISKVPKSLVTLSNNLSIPMPKLCHSRTSFFQYEADKRYSTSVSSIRKLGIRLYDSTLGYNNSHIIRNCSDRRSFSFSTMKARIKESVCMPPSAFSIKGRKKRCELMENSVAKICKYA